MTHPTTKEQNDMSTVIDFPTHTDRGPAMLDRAPTEAELFPHLALDDVCIYCGRFQTDEQAEQRTVAHITADLLAIHRTNEGLKRGFGIEHPGYSDDVYDLLCELDTAERTEALAAMAVAR